MQGLHKAVLTPNSIDLTTTTLLAEKRLGSM